MRVLLDEHTEHLCATDLPYWTCQLIVIVVDLIQAFVFYWRVTGYGLLNSLVGHLFADVFFIQAPLLS